MHIFKQFKIVVIIASILCAQIPQVCKADITTWNEYNEALGKKIIIGCFAATSCALIYKGINTMFKPSIKYLRGTTHNNPIEVPKNNIPSGFCITLMGTFGLASSWFANKYL